MKSNRYKLVATLSSFLVASICLATSTYAWFAIADSFVLDNIKITMKATQNIEVGFYSEDASVHSKYGSDLGTWVDNIFYIDSDKGSITSELLHDFDQLDYNIRFSPLSASYVDTKNGFGTSSYSPILSKMPLPSDVQGLREAKKEDLSYLQFECYIRSNVEDVYIFLQPETSITPNTLANAETASETGMSQEDLDNAVNYMRYSFYSYNDARNRHFYKIFEPNPTNDYQKTSYFGKLDIDPFDGYYDFSYKTNQETVYGAYTGTPIYDESARVTERPNRNTGFNAITYPGVEPFALEQSIEQGFEGKYEDSMVPENLKNHNELSYSIGRVDRDSPTRFVITCWSEGWDLDCTSYSSQASFTMNLSISSESSNRYI